ncbi:MAG: chemotaxis protein CheW [Brevinematales bacterium]|nr:chemotaxis protein CheW [Brevinematales bacterium]
MVLSLIPISIDNKFFGIEIDNVVEIISSKEFFIIPKVPSFTVGLVNIRGEIIPVFSLKNILFGTKQDITGNTLTNIITCKVNDKKLCLLVDKLYKVIYASDENIKSYTENIWKDLRFIKFFVDVKEFNALIGVIDIQNIIKYIDKTNKDFYKLSRR